MREAIAAVQINHLCINEHFACKSVINHFKLTNATKSFIVNQSGAALMARLKSAKSKHLKNHVT